MHQNILMNLKRIFSPKYQKKLTKVISQLYYPAYKLNICRSLKDRGGEFVTLIHPSAIIGPNCSIGEGCILCPGVVLTSDVSLGNFITLNLHATVGHDAKIGDGSTLLSHTDVTGFVELGEGVLLGSHASILPHAKVGDYGIVGAGSVVLRRVKSRTTVIGVPAKKIVGFNTNTSE